MAGIIIFKSGTIIKYLPLEFLSVSYRTPRKNKNAVYRLQISALVPEIFKLEKWVKYANEMTDGIIHSTQYYIEYINRASLPSKRSCAFLGKGKPRNSSRSVSALPPSYFDFARGQNA